MPCLSPNKLADGTKAACRECKQCQLTARNMWVGRNIAESKTNKFCYWITGTYGRGRVGESLHERAVILTPSDCRNLLKLLRRHGYEVRFFITGEYGSERGRAHWNIILYSQAPLPAFAGWDKNGRWKDRVAFKTPFNWVRTDKDGNPVFLRDGNPAYWWPHGFVYVDELNHKNIKYVCKYVLKDFDAHGKQGYKGQSRNPPIGTAWFLQLAEKYVEQGLAPQSPEYRHPEAKTKEGEVIRFWLQGRCLELFLQHYIDTWAQRYPDRPRPISEYVDLFERYGKVVNDEAAMLLRQEFPRGESRDLIPTPEQVRGYLDDLPYQTAVDALQQVYNAERQALRREIVGLPDGEERQSRERQLDDRQQVEYTRFLSDWGREWVFGQGVIIVNPEVSRSGPIRDRGPELVGEPDKPDMGQQQRKQQLLGPVGRYNSAYNPRG